MRQYLALFGPLLLLTGSAVAQVVGTPLPADDPRLYQAFFYFCDFVDSVVSADPMSTEHQSSSHGRSVARKIRVNPEELRKVMEVAHAFVLAQSALNTSSKKYAEKMANDRRPLEPLAREEFDRQRLRLVEDSIRWLAGTLSTESWEGLQAYINKEHRLRTRVRKLN